MQEYASVPFPKCWISSTGSLENISRAHNHTRSAEFGEFWDKMRIEKPELSAPVALQTEDFSPQKIVRRASRGQLLLQVSNGAVSSLNSEMRPPGFPPRVYNA